MSKTLVSPCIILYNIIISKVLTFSSFLLQEAEYLPPRSYGGACDPYLILQLFRDKGRKRWSKSNSSTLYEFRTSSKKKSQHPIFKERFVMEVSRADLREDSIRISVYDDEKYANDSQLGEMTIPLRELNFGRNGEENTTTLEFQEPRKVSHKPFFNW